MAEAIQRWKLDYLGQHKESTEAHSRAVNTVNAHLRNARSLFTAKALEFAGKRLALPDPIPFQNVKLERRRTTTRYSSRIDPSVLLKAAKAELYVAPGRQEQFKIFCLALLCGLRKREIDTLLWRSIDFDKALIRIERTENFHPKSEESASEIDLAHELGEIFRRFHSAAKGEFVIESDNPPRYHLSRANYRAELEFSGL